MAIRLFDAIFDALGHYSGREISTPRRELIFHCHHFARSDAAGRRARGLASVDTRPLVGRRRRLYCSSLLLR